MATGTPTGAIDALAWQESVHREVLPNGLTLLVKRDRSAPVVAIVTHVKAGYFDETDDLVGIAHVLEHMYFKGTPTRGVGAIARETKANGGYLNAHTIYDHTSYYTVLPSSAFERGLEIQFDAYTNSVIDAGELARELEVIIQEAKRKRDSAGAVAIESLYALLHDTHRMRRWRIGEEAQLRGFTRDMVHGFYRHWYQPGNTILAIVGDIEPETARDAVLARYGQLGDVTPHHVAGPREMTRPHFRAREWEGDIAATQVAIGWCTPPLLHADTPALDIAGTALGSGRASRLYRAVRERRLASGVGAFDYTTGDVGVFVVHAESPPQHAAEALLQLWREVHSARRYGVRRSEIARAQSIVEARWLRRLESMDGQASYLASWEAEGGLAVAAEYYDRMLTVSSYEVRDALERHLCPETASIIAYRPTGAAPLAGSAAALREWLRPVEDAASSVLAPRDVQTPLDNVIIGAPAVHVSSAAERVDHGVHVYRTAQGLPVLVLPRVGAPMVNVGLFVRGGAVLEPPHQDGLARLAVQASLKGTQRRSGARIAETAEDLGSSIAASTGLESMGWSMSVPVRHLATATELLADVAQRATFADDAVETERLLAIAEVERLRDDMYRWPVRLAMTAAYGAHPYARGVLGTEQSLAVVDAASVRAFHAAHILRSPAVVAIVGDVQPDEVAALVARDFTAIEYRDEGALPTPVWTDSPRVRTDVRHKQQTALSMLFDGPARHDTARHAARVLSVVSSGLGGRFFEQLRDKQSLAYTVSAYPVERRASGLFAAYIATAPEREDEARTGLLTEFARLRNDAVTDDELHRAQTYLIGTHAIAQQSGAAVLGDLVDAWLFGEGLFELGEFDSQVRAVTPKALQQLANDYFDPERRVEGIVRGTGT
jgi:zinc protease